jgi:4-amino-4-deoxy-L-arabinose transferase-like glycosyltransferase
MARKASKTQTLAILRMGREGNASRALPMPTHYKWGILLVLLTVCLRLPAIVHPKAIDDEAGYATVAHELLHGGTLYISALDRRPPLLFWIYAAIFWVVGPYNWLPFHLIAVAWMLLTMWGLYALGRELFSREVGLAAALLYSIYTASVDYVLLELNGEVMMDLPIVWALYIAFKQHTSRHRPELVLSGVLLCCAFLIKQPAAIAALPVGMYLLLPAYRAQRHLSLRHSVLHATLLTTSYFLTLGIVALVLYYQGILGEAYYWTIGDHDIPHGPTDPIFWQFGVGMTLAFVVAWHPLVFLNVLAVRECCHRGARYWKHLRAEYTALLMLLGCSFIGVSASGRFYPNYFLQLLPALVLLAAPVLMAIWTKTRTYHFCMLQPRTLHVALCITATAFLISNTVTLWLQRPENELSQYVREHSTPEDKVFFWGELVDDLYAEARRRPASRYIHFAPLTGYIWGSPLRYDPHYDTTYRILPGAWDILQTEFQQSPPLFFVDFDPGTIAKKYPPSRYPFLRRLLAQDYEVVLSTPKGVVYRRIDRR